MSEQLTEQELTRNQNKVFIIYAKISKILKKT